MSRMPFLLAALTLAGCANDYDISTYDDLPRPQNTETEAPETTGTVNSSPTDTTTGGTETTGTEDPPAEDDCDHTSDLIYVIDRADEALYTYDPGTGDFDFQGQLSCTMWGTPASMSVSRDGFAYVRYSDDSVYQVDLQTFSCTLTGIGGFGSFGMGFATDNANTWRDTLFAANDDTLAELDTVTGTFTPLGDIPSVAELSGNADGELWALLPLELPAKLVQVDKSSGAALDVFDLPGFPSPMGIDTFAFATWGGEFYLFVREYGMGNSTDVYKVDAAGQMSVFELDTGMDVVGAGVSTCAPAE